MDPIIVVAFLGLLATMGTVAATVIVAVMNNRRAGQEKSDADARLRDSDHVAALKERIALRDEQILDLKEALRRVLVSSDPDDILAGNGGSG